MVALCAHTSSRKVTRHVRLVPWSWGSGQGEHRGVGTLGCGEVRATLVQEKVGGVPLISLAPHR